MGEVYLAEDPQIGRQLAIKTVRVEEGRPQEIEERKKRLLREARAAGKLLHPNIVTLFDAGEDQGMLYLAFEFVEGTDLAAASPRGRRSRWARRWRSSARPPRALDYAHRQGVVHRDIKPSNLMLTADGQVKVADFGIAKVLDQTSDLTMTGSVVGSPHYLSPEQIRGDELDGRSDIFSLGVLLYEMLSRRRPFEGETLTTLVYQILHQEPVAARRRRPDLGAAPEALVRRMLHKDRDLALRHRGRGGGGDRRLRARAVAGAARRPRRAGRRADRRDDPAAAGGVDRAARRGAASPPPPPAAVVAPSASAASAPAAGSSRSGRRRRPPVAAAARRRREGWRWCFWWRPRCSSRWSSPVSAPGASSPSASPARRSRLPSEVVPASPERPAAPAPVDAGEQHRAGRRARPQEPSPLQPGERPVGHRVAASPAPAVAEPSAQAAPPPAPVERRAVTAAPPPATAVAEEPAAAPAAPADAPEEADPGDTAREVREALVLRVPVAREMATGMSLSLEVLPKDAAERVVVRFDRIVIGRAGDWNAKKRGGRAYTVTTRGCTS